jgi:RHS repeat-associated protein
VGTRKLGLYGRLIATTGTPDLIPLGFGARPFYLGGALIDLRARLYDPVLAGFISQDPLGVLTKFPNPYAYASNRPFMFVDPLGLSPEGPSLWNRVFGGLRAIGGLAEGALGILGLLAPEPTMLTKVGGVLLIGHGADQLQAGLRQLWTGENVRTLTSQGLGAGAELIGFDANTAYYIGEFGDAGIGIVLSLGTTAGLQAATAAAPRIGATGQVGEQALQALGGESQVFFRTTQGARYVDQLVGGVANESKVGYTTLTQSVTTQIAKDAELLNTGQVNGVVWHFFTSPVTGQVGPSGPLLQALQNAGITVVIH